MFPTHCIVTKAKVQREGPRRNVTPMFRRCGFYLSARPWECCHRPRCQGWLTGTRAGGQRWTPLVWSVEWTPISRWIHDRCVFAAWMLIVSIRRAFPNELAQRGFIELPVTGQHALAIGDLPLLHWDPFDRMLIAQAMVEGIVQLTSDASVARYPGPIRKV